MAIDFETNYKELSRWPTPSLVLTSFFTFFAGGFHFGFQISAINPLATVLKDFLLDNFKRRYSIFMTAWDVTFVWSSVAGSLFVGAALGALLMSSIIGRLGPRKSLVLSATILLVGAPMAGLSFYTQLAELFILARLVSGVGIGMGTTAQAVYLAEISPVRFRGFTGALSGLMGNMGFVLAAGLGLPLALGTARLWPLVFFVEAVPALVHLLVNATTFCDSPKFLLKQGDEAAARRAVVVYEGREDVDAELERMRFELKSSSQSNKFSDIGRDRSATRALSLSVALNVAVAFSGIMAMSFFGTFLLQAIGFSPNAASLANCLSGLSGTLAAVLATFAFEWVGRRVLVIGSLLLLALINALMMFLVFVFESSKNSALGWPFLALFIVFLFVFSVGVGPAALFLGAELAPSGTIAKMQALSVGSQYIGCFISPVIYLPLNNAVGPLSFLVFILPLSLTAFYFYYCLPETKGKSTEEISELLRK